MSKCPHQGCDKKFPRQNIIKHSESCDYQIVQGCEFSKLSFTPCHVEFPLRDYNKHLNEYIYAHNIILMNNISRLSSIEEKSRKRINQQADKITTLNKKIKYAENKIMYLEKRVEKSVIDLL